MSAHAVGGGGVEAVIAKEAAGRVSGQNLSVKEHRHHVCILGAELHIVGNHHDGNALFFKFA